MSRVELYLWWEKYFSEVLKVVDGFKFSEETAGDITALTFFMLYQKLETGDLSGNDNIHSFLITTARDLSKEHVKKELWQALYPEV